MIARAGRIYIQGLIATEVLLLWATIAIHLGVLCGGIALYDKYHEILGAAVIVVSGSSFAFKRKGVGLMTQIRTCPQWMWKSALVIASYGILTSVTLVIFPPNNVFASSFVGSGFPLGFEAIPLCILYSALRHSRNDGSELIRSTVVSLLFIGCGIIWATTTHQIAIR